MTTASTTDTRRLARGEPDGGGYCPATGSDPGLAPVYSLAQIGGHVPLRFCECDNIFIRREAKRTERCAYCVGDIRRGHVPVMFFNHACVGVTELAGDHRQRSAVHD